jgi:hypothetical protein
LEEPAPLVFRVLVTPAEMWPGYKGRAGKFELQRAGGLINQNQGMGKLPAGASVKEGPYGYIWKCRPLQDLYKARLLKRPVKSKVLVGVSTKESLVLINAHI